MDENEKNKSELSRSEAAKAEATEAGAAESKTAKAEATEAGAAEGKTAKAEATEAGAAESKTAKAEATEAGAAESEVSETEEQKKSKPAAFFSKNKKAVIVIAIALAVLLLTAILLLVLLLPKNNTQPSESSVSDSSDSVESSSVSSSSQSSSSESSEEASSEQGSEQSSVGTTVPVQSGSAQRTGYEPLDSLVSGILSRTVSSGASATSKLNAIYRYVRNNMTYDMFAPGEEGLYDKLRGLGYSDYDATQMALAYNAITYRRGVCDNYSALTMVLARAVGIPLYQSGGLSADGTSHAWNILIVDGVKYIVDTNYGIFMRNYTGSGYVEQMDGSKYFNGFRVQAPSVEEKKISWMFNAGYGNQRFMGNDRGEITQTASIDRPMYGVPSTLYPEPITPMVTTDGASNSFSATVSAGGAVIETLKQQSGAEQSYYFSWYPPNPGSYVIEITMNSDSILVAHYIIYVNLT